MMVVVVTTTVRPAASSIAGAAPDWIDANHRTPANNVMIL
jgi:hypothetical protein